MESYATVEDVIKLWRELTEQEQERAEALLPIVAARLREAAKNRCKDLDEMIEADPDLAAIAKQVSVDVVARTLMTSTDQEPMSQYAESAGGYSVSGTFLVPGGGLFIKNAELASLGLLRQRFGMVDMYGID
ncbi:MAG: phage Gp19/Gp15/Gp42 family protein [Bacteroidales bacterium]|nr:phage Gp19/Gp15/Gp42 family protein [Bacteroidales bacterium]